MANRQNLTISELQDKANAIREDVIKMLTEAGSGHSAGPLGMADVFTALYFGGVMKYDPKNTKWEGRDYLVLSNGHICPILYATMAHAGFLPKEEMMTLRKLGTRLQGHPHRAALPGLETTSGPLGSGTSQGAGMAYALRMDKKRNRVFVLQSDGEHDAGNTWEGVMFAGKNKLSNLTAIMDRNNIQIDGNTEDIMPLEPMREKYEAFNWHVLDVDGHNIEAVLDAVNEAKAIAEKPTMILAHTIPGKGVKFMEGDYTWHGKPPMEPQDAVQAIQDIHELRTLGGKIISEHE